MKFKKLVKATEDSVKFDLTSDLFEAITNVLVDGAYKIDFQEGRLTKNEILECLEEASVRLEEALADN